MTNAQVEQLGVIQRQEASDSSSGTKDLLLSSLTPDSRDTSGPWPRFKDVISFDAEKNGDIFDHPTLDKFALNTKKLIN